MGDSDIHVKGLNFILIKNVSDKKELDSRKERQNELSKSQIIRLSAGTEIKID